MSEEWFDVAWINFDEAILHGQYIDDGVERRIRNTLNDEQKRAVEDLNAKQTRELYGLLRSFVA